MLKIILSSLLFLISLISFSQVKIDENERIEINETDIDSIFNDTILLKEVLIFKQKLDPEAKKQFLLLQNRVYKVYPYAKIASERLTSLNANIKKLKSNKEKKKYFKIAENYMENEFKGQLKKLSRKQGQILVKLIHRQTGYTTYDLIKDYKSGWRAFWSNNTAKLFDINLKVKYNPYNINEDYLIETILYRAFISGRLIKQESTEPIDIDELNEYWENLSNKKVK
jgi:hypothetical protein